MGNRQILKIIRDPIHEYITIFEDEIRLLDCVLFQRLRNIKQNGMGYYTYPALTGSRFEHSLGVMHLADQMLSSALEKSDPSIRSEFLILCAKEFGWPEEKETVRIKLSRVIRVVGMLHDLGQMPFSHTSEELVHQSIENIMPSTIMDRWRQYVLTVGGALHEFLALLLIESDPDISEALGEDLEIVLRILLAAPEDKSIYSTLHEIVAFDIDADRADYLLRDGRASSAEFGGFDLSRLVDGMRIGKVEVASRKKEVSFVIRPTIQALSAVESLIIERYKSYRWLYHHQRVVVTNRILQEIIWRLFKANWDNISPLNNVQLLFPLDKPKSPACEDWKYEFCDDIDVINMLRQAKILLENAEKVDGITTPETWIEQREFRALLDEILLRKKRGISLWKDVGTYKQFNGLVANEIEAIFRNHQFEAYRRAEGRMLPADAVHEIRQETEFVLNWVVDRLLQRSFAKIKELETQINDQLRSKKNKIDGFILLAVTFFKPWEYRGEREYEVIGRENELYHVSDVSPIVKQLHEVTKSSIRMYAYLILDREIENLSLSKQRDTMQQIMEKSKRLFADSLIKWVRNELSQEIGR